MKEGAGRCEEAGSETWFLLPILFGFGGQKVPRKEFPNDSVGAKTPLVGGGMGWGPQGQGARAPESVNTARLQNG